MRSFNLSVVLVGVLDQFADVQLKFAVEPVAWQEQITAVLFNWPAGKHPEIVVQSTSAKRTSRPVNLLGEDGTDGLRQFVLTAKRAAMIHQSGKFVHGR
jgi:hypothetical protein